jgi:hypothetical protein
MRVELDYAGREELAVVPKHGSLRVKMTNGCEYILREEGTELYINVTRGKLAAISTGGVNVLQLKTLPLND